MRPGRSYELNKSVSYFKNAEMCMTKMKIAYIPGGKILGDVCKYVQS